ncbi:hypothetical protein C6V83_10820 [Gordonia iterans]|uniref:Uncharacterized protein n=1 Tax=Gordonia iterans TaxID=1004901 RepID=A0A2S0KG64_9ACTN|nr:hypothetical protein [Gordonia iterans]AVM00690.1 hypothetical protein C6V83_10820 [Gordonia iterans]
MAKSKDDNPGCLLTVVGVLVIGAIAAIPAGIWIVLGALAGTVALVWIMAKVRAWLSAKRALRQAAAEEALRAEERACAEREEWEKQQRARRLGKKNARCLEAAIFGAQRIADSDAAREGWLGDVDFGTDIASITDSFGKAAGLRETADRLAKLRSPGDDDRRIVAEARSAADALERSGTECADLIGRCAAEVQLIDQSLRREREEARTAQQRAELHRELSTMLYGIEAAPTPHSADSGAARVMTRVSGYREIKQQITLVRQRAVDSGPRPEALP